MNTHDLQIDSELQAFINSLLDDLGYEADSFWRGFADIIREFAPRHKALLQKREHLQTQIDQWHETHPGAIKDAGAYEKFLRSIGYITDEGEDFSITTENIDDEIAMIAGPQLVVPVKNARFALNACNARWGSLYDALCSSDVIDNAPPTEKQESYNSKRSEAVIAWACDFLNKIAPLKTLRYEEVASFRIENRALIAINKNQKQSPLSDPALFVGYRTTESVLLRHNDLHIELLLDENNPQHVIKDVVLEAALTTIMDAEDSVVAVDAEDKCEVYRNWLGLMRGDLTAEIQEGDKSFTRRMNADREFTAPDGSALILSGRSLMLMRNVGHLMTNPAVRYGGEEIPEGLLDAVITALIAHYDIRGKNKLKNSRTASMYIVKPKMHGPEEATLTDDLFNAVEDLLGYERYTLKVGVMDEERRTSLNLKETIRAVEHRLIFINTGFLDRTGDEIHTSMRAGVMLPKAEMKQTAWLAAYEKNNVAIGLRCGLRDKAQIGKGMWAMPDRLKAMLQEKTAHLLAGADCAWVPSPMAAVLHATHYHEVSVSDAQETILKNHAQENYLSDLLKIPLAEGRNFSEAEILRELDNNIQGILGYIVRWVHQGVGCSKVPDIDDIGLMEDRATLRISSQHVTNWLLHGVCDEAQVMESFRRMAGVVDAQNSHDGDYISMCDDLDNSLAFRAACDLVFRGVEQPSGYTEPILHSRRLAFKESFLG